jgi:hypothetical protein
MFLATFGVFERLGVHITPVHFYYPIPDTRHLPERLWSQPSAMVGVDLRAADQLQLLSECEALRDEYEAIPRERAASDDGFYLDNPFFGPVDAEMLYCIVRLRKPKRIIEIGGGYSTLLTLSAMARNADVNRGSDCSLIVIEPFPTDTLRRQLDGRGQLMALPLQVVGFEPFTQLADNDIVFIDSSHVVSVGSDVCFEILELLPRLPRGVLVHFHDVFLPWQYPREWFTRLRRFWSEQYLLQAFLTSNSAYEVVWAGHWMHRSNPGALSRTFRSHKKNANGPGSFWIRRTS